MIAVVTCGHRPDDERIYSREIKSLLSAGYKITYFTRWRGDSFLSEDNLWHRNYSQKDLSISEYIKGILNDFKVLKPSGVHIHEFELLPLAKKAQKLYRSKIVYDVHEANIELWDAFSSKPKALKNVINKTLEKYEKSYLKYVNNVLAVTPELVSRYKKYGLNSYFVPNYPVKFPRSSRKNNITTIIYHGQISIERGLEDLINALPILVSDNHKFSVEIYGTERKPGIVKELTNLIDQLNLNKIVKISDQIPHNDMLKILSKAHIAVIPFHDNAMFQLAIPVKMFEAMWARCAIIASDLKPMRRYGKNVFEFYPPGDVDALSRAIKKLLIKEDVRKQMGSAGALLIENKYNWKMVEPTLLSAYKDIVN